jgi:mannose-6-phosphate isomerase-like protein (cupin superfamily)
VLVLDGEDEVTAGDERMRLAAGGIALVPATVPHDLPDAGQGTLRIVGSSPEPP